MADHFDDQATAQLRHDEGTISFVYTLNQPLLAPPPQTRTLLETRSSAEVKTRLQVNPHLELVFCRGDREISLSLAPLRGGTHIYIGLGWGPRELHLYAGAQDLDSELLHASIAW